MKKYKQIISMLLALAVMCTVLASCGNENGNVEDDNLVEDDSDNGAENIEEKLIDEDTIVWKVYDSAGIYVKVWEEALNELLAEKGVKYTVKIESYGDSVYEDMRDDIPIDLLAEMKESGESVDLITTTPSAPYQMDGENVEFLTTYEDAVSMDILISLDEYLESDEGQVLKAAILPENLERAEINGKVYGISQWMRLVTATVYNKDLLEKYDIEVSDLSPDVFENKAIIQKVVEGEQAPKKIFAGYVAYFNEGGLGMWLTDQCSAIAYDNENDKFVNLYESDTFKSYVNEMYALKDSDLLVYRYAGYDNFFAIPMKTENNEIYEDTISFVDTNDNSITKDVIVVPDSESPLVNIYNTDKLTGIASWSNKTDYALDFLTRLFTDPDIANIIQYGIEGENYVLDDERAVRQTFSKYAEDGTEIVIGYSEWNQASNFANSLITYSEPTMAADKVAYMEYYFENEPENLPIGFRFDPETVSDELEAIFNVWLYDIQDTELYKFSTDDTEAALDEINQLLKEAGIDKVVEEIQRQYDEWKAEQN